MAKPEFVRPGGQAICREDNNLTKDAGPAAPVQDDPALLQEVLSYLKKMAKECGTLPHYFPDQLRRAGESAFDKIRQTVCIVTDRRAFDKWLAAERKRLQRDGIDPVGMVYGPSRGMPEEEEGYAHRRVPLETIPWDERAGSRLHQATMLGDPGFGKSWLLRYEAREAANRAIEELTNGGASVDDIDLPILMRLPDLAHRKGTFEDIIVTRLRQKHSGSFSDFVRTRIESGHAILLLDAWDEIGDLDARRKLRDKIHDCQLPGRVLLTSRMVGYSLTAPPLPDGKEVELVAWKWEQIQSFVQVWFGTEEQSAKLFLGKLKKHPQFRGLARIPLMLMLLCRTYPEGDFPQRRSDVYEKCLEGLCRDWHIQDKSRYTEAELADTYIDELIDIVGDASLELYERGVQQFRERELGRILRRCLDDLYRNEAGGALAETRTNATSLIKRLKEDGVLVSATSDDRDLRFLHLTLQEYCAARSLARRTDCVDQALRHVYQPAWGQVLAMLGGITKTPGPYIAALLRENKNDLLCRPFALAIRAAAECDRKEKARVLCSEAAAELIHMRACSGHRFLWDIAWQAIRCLPEAVESIVIRVGRECQSTAERIDILSECRCDTAVLSLLKLLSSGDKDTRISASVALRKMPSERAIPTLLKMLNGEDRYIRPWVIGALETIGSERAVPALLKMLNDKDRDTRVAAVLALGKIGSGQAVPLLLDAIRDRDMRGSIACALGDIGSEEAVPYLLAMLRDRAPGVRWGAAIALGRIGSERGIPSLLQSLRGKRSDVRRCAAWAIGGTHSNEAKQHLRGSLLHKDRDIREAAAWGCRDIGSTQVIKALIKGLKDRSTYVRGTAAWNLGRIGSAQAIPALCKALRDKDAEVRMLAADALGTIGSEQAVSALLKSLRDKDKSHHAAVARALGKTGSGWTTIAVLPLLDDEDSSVRAAATDAVRKICPDQGVSIPSHTTQVRKKPSDVEATTRTTHNWQSFVEFIEHLAGLCENV